MNLSSAPAMSNSQAIAIAIQKHQAGHLQEAETIYLSVLAADPENFDALHLLGVLAHQIGRNDVAVDLIGRAVQINAAYPAALINLGEAFRALQQFDKAEGCYRQAIVLNPDYAEAYNNLGNLLNDLGRAPEAEQAFRRALFIKPDFSEAYNNLGNSLQGLGRLEEAAQAFLKAIAIKPDFAAAHSNFAVVLNDLGRYEEAEQACRRALTLEPGFAAAHCNLGIALKELGRFEEALPEYRQALKIEPESASAYSSLGNVLKELGRLDEAEKAYLQALAIKPDLHECRLKLAMMLPTVIETAAQADDVSIAFNRALDNLEHSTGPGGWSGLGAVVGVAQPFNLAYRLGNHTASLSRYGTTICRASRAWRDASRFSGASFVIPERDRVRMVIVSGHVSQHSVWNVLLHGLLRHLDRSRFEVILYHTGPVRSVETSYAQALADRLVQGPVDWVAQVYGDAPDVIFYPEIAMDSISLKLAALRLAPLQAAGWGHPITTGLPTIDLFISGELIEREDADSDYSEKLVRLPGTGACTILMRVTAAVPDLTGIDIPQDRGITRFLICQQAIKYDPTFDDIYPRIANEKSASRFWYMRDSKYPWAADIVEKRIRNAFQTAGLDPAVYVRFIDWLPGDQFWGLLDMMDIFLDTPAFSGYTTAWQAVHRGLPVVTLEGKYLRQRLAAGLLRRLGVTETIAADTDEYISKTVALARDQDGRRALKTRLQAAAPQADEDVRVVRAFENAILDALAERTRVFGG